MATVFDDPFFHSAYMAFRNADIGFNRSLENPTMIKLLEAVKIKNALDLGCGTGSLTRQIAKSAQTVVGIDGSERMLAVADRETHSSQTNVQYRYGLMEEINLPTGSFDVIVSSLAFHYLKDLQEIFNKCYRWLSDSGHMFFSVEHPNETARYPQQNNNLLCAGDDERRIKWLGTQVTKYHRCIATYSMLLQRSGFLIASLKEPVPTCKQLKNKAALTTLARPPFVFFHAVKQSIQ